MKIVSIEVSNFLHFADATIHFTYPEHHPKAGQPLDKVCFIGQSGTGKTTLLNEIVEFASSTSNTPRVTAVDLHDSTDYLNATEQLKATQNDGLVKLFQANNVSFDDKLLFFATELLANETHVFQAAKNQATTQNEQIVQNSQVQKQIQQQKEKKKQQFEAFLKQNVIRVEGKMVWHYVFEEIRHYDELLSIQGKLFIQKTTNSNIETVLKELADWKSKNLNPRKALADNCLNPLLRFFQLEVDVDNTEVPIAVKSIKGGAVPANALSTGTKQIILTALPLYKLQTPDSVVLFDEPERSLFPDLQQIIVDYYTSLAPNSQFFFATHSPFVAAAFEPYERFILYFDEEGKVRCKNGVAPIGDDPNDILKKDFEIANLMNDHGRAKYKAYLQLKTKIRNETNPQHKDELLAELTKLGNDYNF